MQQTVKANGFKALVKTKRRKSLHPTYGFRVEITITDRAGVDYGYYINDLVLSGIYILHDDWVTYLKGLLADESANLLEIRREVEKELVDYSSLTNETEWGYI